MGYYDDSHGSVWRLAVHETGHGLMYVVHGGTIKALAVRPWAGDNDGYCRAELAVALKAAGGMTRDVYAALTDLGYAQDRCCWRIHRLTSKDCLIVDDPILL